MARGLYRIAFDLCEKQADAPGNQLFILDKAISWLNGDPNGKLVFAIVCTAGDNLPNQSCLCAGPTRARHAEFVRSLARGHGVLGQDAELGCGAPQIMAYSGHKNLKEVQTCIEAANRLGLARQALQMQVTADANRTRTVKPSGEV